MELKSEFRYIFIVLVYKNTDVLRDFFKSLKIIDNRVIVVNSYYDEKSLRKCEEITNAYNADFISIENKGFGYGNNVGAKYAIDNYKFDYLVLSNSDIQINEMTYLDKIVPTAEVIAPHTHLLSSKVQNPNIPWYMPWLIPLFHFAYKQNSRKLLYIPRAMSRLARELFFVYHKIVRKDKYKIYSCHGSFIIFTKGAVERLFPFFNEKMFLYNEELFLAEKCRLAGVPIFYCPSIDVLHLEGASSSGLKNIGFKHNKQSFETFYAWLQNNQ